MIELPPGVVPGSRHKPRHGHADYRLASGRTVRIYADGDEPRPPKPVECVHLGRPRVGGDGLRVMMKCGCGRAGEVEKYLPVFDCHCPHTPQRCVPGFDPAEDASWWTEDFAVERATHALCEGCDFRQPKPQPEE